MDERWTSGSSWASQVVSLRDKKQDSGMLFQALQVTHLKIQKLWSCECVCVCVYMCVSVCI